MWFPKALELDQSYINALNHARKYAKVHHVEDNKYLLYFNSSIWNSNRLVDLDMKHLSTWLNVNKFSLDLQKTELVIFKKKRKTLEHEIKIQFNRKGLYPTPGIKY